MSVAAPERPRAKVERREPIPHKSVEQALTDTLVMLEGKGLPIYQKKDEVTHFIEVNERSIIEGETGSGKSTVSPVLALAVAEMQNQSKDNPGKVVVTQPRRVAAQSLHSYLEPTMGDRVGYRHGGGSSITENTKLEFAIERSLLNDIVRGDDPDLSKYSTVIVDEVHERTVDSSILMAFLKKIQVKRRGTNNPLKIILTSATLNKQEYIDWFSNSVDPNGPPLESIKVEGKMFDVKEHFEQSKVDIRDVEKVAAQRAIEVFSRGEKEPGDMLIFMPGSGEIKKTIAALDELKTRYGITDDQIEFVSLMGGNESAESMKKIYEKSTKRRIFVATNVAETSITIPSVRVVIDSGLMRVNFYDPETGMSGLRTEPATQSNARQRRGRAGRVSEGTVHFLYTKEDFNSRKEFLPPEILRTDLITQVLLMKEIGITDILNFDFLDHPGKDRINQAIKSLELLGALNEDGTLSEIGRRMTEINAEPRFARMLIEAEKLGCRDDVALVIGMFQNARYDLIDRSYRINDPIFSKFIDPNSDIRTRLNIWNEYIQHNSSKAEREKWEAETKFKTVGFYKASGSRQEMLKDRNVKDGIVDISPENMEKIYQSIAVGFIDNIVINKNGQFQTLNGTPGVRIDNRSSVMSGARPPAFISGNLRRTEKGPIFAGLNFPVSIDVIKGFASYLEGKLPGDKLTTKDEERTIEAIASEIGQASKNQDEGSVIKKELYVPLEIEYEKKHEEKSPTGVEKVKESVRSWLRKLRLVK